MQHLASRLLAAFYCLLSAFGGCTSSGNINAVPTASLQVGMPRQQVEALLKDSQVEYGWYPEKHLILAIDRRPSRNSNSIGKSNSQLQIEFDDNDKVVRISQKELFTGP